MSLVYESLKDGLEDAIEYHKGTRKLQKTRIVIPSSPTEYTSKDLKRLRADLGVSQRELAQLLYVSTKTVQAWEGNTRRPQSSTLRLLQILDNRCEILPFDRDSICKEA